MFLMFLVFFVRQYCNQWTGFWWTIIIFPLSGNAFYKLWELEDRNISFFTNKAQNVALLLYLKDNIDGKILCFMCKHLHEFNPLFALQTCLDVFEMHLFQPIPGSSKFPNFCAFAVLSYYQKILNCCNCTYSWVSFQQSRKYSWSILVIMLMTASLALHILLPLISK